MAEYLKRRIVTLVPVLLGVSFAVFMMLHFLPGDPVMMMLTEHRGGSAPTVVSGITEEMYENMRRELGLDRPLAVQFGAFVWGAVRGDLGNSFRTNRPVAAVLGANLRHTIWLALTSLGVAIVLGMGFGLIAAVNRDSWIDGAAMTFSLLGVSMPNFWLGIMLLLVFALHLNWLPALSSTADWRSLVLPAVTLGFSAAAIIARLVRSSLIEVLNQDYIRTARAKGASRWRVIFRHALRNSLIPVVTIVGLQFGSLLGGSVVVEVVFGRPGIGQVLIAGIFERDFPIVQGIVLFIAVAYVFMNLLVDLTYAWLDPRLSYQ
jgi:peptide/nickel transport system permease protein